MKMIFIFYQWSTWNMKVYNIYIFKFWKITHGDEAKRCVFVSEQTRLNKVLP